MKMIFKKIIDRFRKKKIFEIASRCGFDIDGDIICYKGTMYYFDILNNVLMRIEKKRCLLTTDKKEK